MKPRRRTTPPSTALVRPEVFRVREHTLIVMFVADGRWSVSVDGGPASGTFGTQVEAWEAGVLAADGQDRPRHA
jgi:hypothetical protein